MNCTYMYEFVDNYKFWAWLRLPGPRDTLTSLAEVYIE